ncbi:MAG: hypothetical protein ACTSVB_04440 [Candidatus Heimdallarchaeaceae archaeon]
MGKLATFVMIILVVGLTFAIIGNIVNDFKTYYPETEVNTSWVEAYDYSSEINESVGGLKEDFATLTDTEKGWFSRIGAGITAIPNVIIFVPKTMFEVGVYATNIISKSAKQIPQFPTFIIPFAIIAIVVGLFFLLISFWRRYSS